MGPAALGMAVTQFNVLIDRFLALWIAPWAPAALTYSERLVYLPLGVIATAMGTVLLPAFSTHAAEGDHETMGNTISRALRHLVFIMVPASLGLLVLAPRILSTIMELGGAFDAESTRLSARALVCYAPGLVVFSAAKILVPAFYAMQDTKTPVRVGMATVALNLVLNITFILTLPTEWKHAGMAFSTVLSGSANVAILSLVLAKRIRSIQWMEVSKGFARCLACAAVMGVAAWLAAHYSYPILESRVPAKFAQIGSLVFAVGTGASVYFILALGLKAPELGEIKAAGRRH